MDNEIYQTPSVRPTCPVCRAQVDSLLCKKAGCDIWRCAICATDFVHPVPDDVALQAYYDSASYFQNGDGGAYENYDDQTRRVLPIFHQILEECEQAWVGRHLLDFGCAYGTHLQIAYDRGWKCHGIEVSKHARRIARERHGDKFSIVDCIENLPAQCFDLIVMLDVIEHLGDPYKLFDRLVRRGAIGPKTKVVITTPNARSFDAISDPVNWAYRYPPAHLVYYSSESLKRLLASVHFAVVDVAGIYPSLVHETLAYENEFFQNNDQVATYDGLLCIAWRMTFSEPSDQKNFAKLQNEILELEQKVVGLASARIHLRNEIEELLDQLNDREEQLRLITQSKLFRLRACIVEEPFSLRKLAKLGYLTLALLLPRGFKGAAASFARNLKRFLPWRNSWDEVGAYHVKIPVAVGEGRPRVMHAIGNFMTGGSSRLVVDLLERLSSHFEQEILTSFVPNPPAYVGLKVHEYRYLINSNRVLALLKKFKPDIVHVHYWGDVDKSWYGKIFEAAQRYGCKIIENINTPVEPFLADGIHRYVYVSDYVRRHFGEPEIGRAHV